MLLACPGQRRIELVGLVDAGRDALTLLAAGGLDPCLAHLVEACVALRCGRGRAYGLRSSTVSGGCVNSGSLIAFLRLTAITGTRAKPSFSYRAIAAALSCATDRSI